MSEGFFAKHRTLIFVAVAAAAAVAGAYYLQAPPPPKERRKKPKKKIVESEAPFPVDAEGLPTLTSDVVAALSDEQREEWAIALKKAGNEVYKDNDYERAISFYSAALQVKEDPIFYSNRSACYAALGRHEEVVSDALAAIRIKPDYTKCILRRATLYEALERYTEAMHDLTALTIYGQMGNKVVESLLERVLQKHAMKIVDQREQGRVPQLPLAATCGAFWGAFKSDLEDEVGPEGISASSEGADGALYRGIVALARNQQDLYDEADAAFQQAVEMYGAEPLEPAKATIALEYALALAFLKNDRTTLNAAIDRAIALAPRARTYVLRALIHADNLLYSEALQCLEKAREIEPENGDVYYHTGQYYFLTGDNTNAEINFLKAKQYNPKNVYAYIQLACIIYKRGEFEDSDKAFNEARLKFPTSPEVLNYYGEILGDHGNYEHAMKQYDVAAHLQKALPNFSVGATPLVNKATLLAREGPEKYSEATELFTKACELDPRSEMARMALAQLMLQQDQPDLAVLLFEQALDLARTYEEKIQAISFAEATKMQIAIRNDEVLSKKMREMTRGM